MKVFIQTHSYLINMDNVVYLSTAADGEKCVFKLIDGGQIIATCSYNLVIDAIDRSRWVRKDSTYTHYNMVVITLDY